MREKIFKGSLTLSLGQFAGYGCSFIRNLILARCLTKSEFGIAALVSLTVSSLEMLSDLNIDKYLIQSSKGDSRELQNSSHAFMIMRGCFASLLLFVFAPTLAVLFGIPNEESSFKWLSLIPLLKSFVHTDVYRSQRELNFSPFIRSQVISQLSPTLFIFFASFWIQSYKLIIFAFFIQFFTYVILTRVFASRSYRLQWNSVEIKSMLHFGWPLLLNGILMFAIFQGDRFIIGSAGQMFTAPSYSLEDVGLYTIAFSLTLIPANLISRVMNTLFLPIFTKLDWKNQNSLSIYHLCLFALSVVCLLLFALFTFCGERLLILFYTEKYVTSHPLLVILMFMQALRILRIVPTTLCISQGKTRLPLIANVCRSIALLMALWFAYQGASLDKIALCGVFGELLALLVISILIQQQIGVRFLAIGFSFAILSLVSSCIYLLHINLPTYGLWLFLLFSIFIFFSSWFVIPHVYKKFQLSLLMKKCKKRRSLVLSFDDGPSTHFLDKLLETLNEHKVKASFFLTGEKVEKSPDAMKKITSLNHDVYSHSYQHYHAWKTTPQKVIVDLEKGLEVLTPWNEKQIFIRPPYGKIHLLSLIFILSRKLQLAWWTHDSGDTSSPLPDPENKAKTILNDGGGIVLFHDLDRNTEREEYVLGLVKSLIHHAPKFKIKLLRISDLHHLKP